MRSVFDESNQHLVDTVEEVLGIDELAVQVLDLSAAQLHGFLDLFEEGTVDSSPGDDGKEESSG